MPEILPNRLRRPAIDCFPIPESQIFNGLVLIRFCLARDTRTCMGHLIQGALSSCATRKESRGQVAGRMASGLVDLDQCGRASARGTKYYFTHLLIRAEGVDRS